MSAFNDMEQAVRNARDTLNAADANVAAMVRLCAHRLRTGTKDAGWSTVDALKALKAELHHFDSRTGRWKDPA